MIFGEVVVIKSVVQFLARFFNAAPKNKMKPDKSIVGLGNPGAQYRATRHNVGYMVIDELVARFALGAPRRQFHAETWDWQVSGKNVMLMQPTTFMNLSGQAVAEAIRFYKLDPKSDLFVICDDLDLPVAKLRVRQSAGNGGQKGLKDIGAKVGGQDFARLRIGIGRPASTNQVVDFVLSSFRKEERDEIELAIKDAGDAVVLWLEKGIADVMNRYNGGVAANRATR